MQRVLRESWPFACGLLLGAAMYGVVAGQPVPPPVRGPHPVPAPNVPGGKVVLPDRNQLRAGPNTNTARLPHALRAAIEKHEIVVPATYDWTKNNTISFPILGNDQWGDCYYACICHDAQARAGMVGSQITFDPAKVIARYRVLSGGDNGLSDEDVIPEYKKGIVGPGGPHKILDTLVIPSTDQTALDLTGYAFGPQWFTFTVYSSFMSQAKAGAFIDSVSGGKEGGHAVLCSGNTSRGRKIETWGMSPSVEIGKNFIADVDPEFVAVFSLEWFDAKGFAPNGQHYSTLAPLWNSMGGSVPVPGPFPPPTPPVPPPVPPPPGPLPPGTLTPGAYKMVPGTYTFTVPQSAGLDESDKAVLDAIRKAVDALQQKYQAKPVPAPPTSPTSYEAIKAQALADNVSVAFFVNQSARPLPGVRTFAGEDSGRPPYVTLLAPAGDMMNYLDVPGVPSDGLILDKLSRAPRAARSMLYAPNVGACRT